jgi:hypothetical protein
MEDHLKIIDASGYGYGDEVASLLTMHAHRLVEGLNQALARENQTQVIGQP